ncbi:MAG: protein of unknown function DUF11 [candidate division WS6 bacterium 34_10]|uniref:Internalin Ig-like inter-repeat region domain-containing protein n=1 Tax=candidate division WS6 bacterium 34_10 TaxID=1641389 RepID=A0A101HGS1_9BACT|nr:MAG: protein of unknown function DUF11 [candidate division WS6 bacterium 34_10]
MALVITKKVRTILLIVLAILVIGGGGFIIWRVTQEESIAPTESDAGGGNGSCCYKDIGCVSGWVCTSKYCGESAGSGIYSCSQFNGNKDGCNASGHCFWDSSNEVCYTGTCVPEDGPPSEGDCKDVKCEWPTVVMSHLDCACKRCNEVSGVCSGDPEKCNPPSCPSGYVSCGVSGNHESSADCKRSGAKYCWGNHPDCNNPFVVYRYCKPEVQEPVNTCEGGNWASKPSGSYEYGVNLNPIIINTSDADGLGEVTITVNGTSVPTCGPTVGITCYRKEGQDIKLLLDPGLQDITPGSYSINVSWKDGKGKGGSNCELSTSFTINEETVENICEGGNWANQPSGTYGYGVNLNPIIINTSDADGLGEVTITVNGTSVPTCGPTEGVTCYTIDGQDIGILLDPGLENITTGSYSINVSWKDGKGKGGSNCELSTSFTINEEPVSCGDGKLDSTLGEECEVGNPLGVLCTWDVCIKSDCSCPVVIQTNPDWTIKKTAIPQCIIVNDETYANGSYTVTVTNVGEGNGNIDKIVDQLDETVLEEYLKEISDNGVYSSGVITWDLEGEEEIFSPQESLQLTYNIEVPAEDFGTFENLVTAYPTEGDNFSDDESLELICDIKEEPEIPETGIFDTVMGKILFGVILILIGISWPNITEGMIKLNYSFKEQMSDRRMKNFERKVVKDK